MMAPAMKPVAPVTAIRRGVALCSRSVRVTGGAGAILTLGSESPDRCFKLKLCSYWAIGEMVP
jgi:hypothetical protein